MLILYNIFYILFILCYVPFLLIKRKYHSGLLMRLGIFSQDIINKLRGQKVIWLHAVSVGEVTASKDLIKNLRQEYSDFRLVISTVTKTGNKVAQSIVNSKDLLIYPPLDISFITQRTINLLNPKLVIIVETEIWPSLVTALEKNNIPVVLVNGRISSSSFKNYKIIKLFLKNILRKFSFFCMQTKEDAQRIITLGAEKYKVRITGNMKFDLHKPETKDQRPDLGLSREEQFLIAGSTHRGEEKIILQVFKELVKEYPNLRLLIAPRHIERTREVEGLVTRFGFESRRVSSIAANRKPSLDFVQDRQTVPLRQGFPQRLGYGGGVGAQANRAPAQKKTWRRGKPILILDTIGQLKNLYVLADIVFVGGSLIRHGGQNPIEPAVFAKAILFGPYMSNFSTVAELFLSRQAALKVKNAQQLEDACSRLLNESDQRERLGKRAREVIQENKGTTIRNIELIRGLLGRS